MSQSSSSTKNAIKDVDTLIADLGDVSLEGIYDIVDKKNEKIRTLNVPKLVKNLVGVTLHLSKRDPSGNNNVRYNADEKRLISDFTTNFNNTVEYFMDFLDYDGDNQIKLVRFEKNKGKIELGEDLEAFLDDMKDIGSAFKTNAKPADKVFSALTKVLMYMLSDEYVESKEDIVNFNASIKVTFESFKALKDINHKRVFDSRVDDMISFIIMYMISAKLGYINKAQLEAELKQSQSANATNNNSEDSKDNNVEAEVVVEIILPNNEVADAIKAYYGDHLGTVLELANQLTKKMIKTVESNKWKKFKQKFCCCCVSADVAQ